MADFSVSGIIEGDSTSFQEAINQASEALGSFIEIAGGVAAGEGIANLFSTVINGAVGMVSSIATTAQEFQDWGAVINDVGSNTSDMYSGISDAAAGAGAKQAASALEAQDALITYNEKLKEIQDNITEVMSGQNIIDAQSKFADQLGSIEENYAAKVKTIQEEIQAVYDNQAQTHQDKVQSMNDALADMQTNHENKMADTKAKQQEQVDLAFGSLAKKALQDKFDKENKITEDAYKRDYDLKKAQEERGIAESDAKAKAAADKKVATLQEQLDKENKLHDEQVAKLRKQEDEQLAKLETDNAKKLASYQRELADEERAYQLSLAKRAASAAGGRGGGGGAAGLLHLDRNILEAGDTMGKTKDSASSLLEYMDRISNTTPFRLEDLEKSGELFTENNADAAKMLPAIQDLAGHFQKDLGTTSNAVLMAMHGRAMELKNVFNITGPAMEQALGRPLKTSNDVLEAIQKIATSKFGDGVKVESDKSSSSMVQFHNQITKLVLAFAGIDEATGKPLPGGMFDSMQKMIKEATAFLIAHHKEIAAFVSGVVKAIGDFAKMIVSHWSIIKPILEALAIILAIVFASTVITAIVGIVSSIAAFVGVFTVAAGTVGGLSAVIGLAIAAIGGPITLIAIAVVGLGLLFIFHFKEIKKVVGEVVDFISKNFITILSFMGPAGTLIAAVIDVAAKFISNLRKGQDAFTALKNAIAGTIDDIGKSFDKLINFAKNALSYLNPFAKHSPSLVEQIRGGVDMIKSMYDEVGNIQINAPSMSSAYTPQGTQVYNYNSNSTPVINQSNTFSIQGQANANNIASYLAFQLEHLGIT